MNLIKYLGRSLNHFNELKINRHVYQDSHSMMEHAFFCKESGLLEDGLLHASANYCDWCIPKQT